MKLALMADIHANLEALLAVLQDANSQCFTNIAFLGDIVDFGADPKACLDIVRASGQPCVKGEHDHYCALSGVPFEAASPAEEKRIRTIEWTRRQLTLEDRQWLGGLPYVLRVADFTIVHAHLDAPEKWEFIYSEFAAVRNLCLQETALCFCGHTHIPIAWSGGTVVTGGTYSKFHLEQGRKYLVNVGSVGQPRDGNPNAAYVIYDPKSQTIELRRVPYDTETAQRKIRDAGIG